MEHLFNQGLEDGLLAGRADLVYNPFSHNPIYEAGYEEGYIQGKKERI